MFTRSRIFVHGFCSYLILKAYVFPVSNLMLTADFRRVLSRCHKDTNTRVRKGILSGSEIQCGIRKNAKYLDGIRDLTVTRQARFAKVLAGMRCWGRKNGVWD